MFDNVGKKLKIVSKIFTWIGIVLVVFAGIPNIILGFSYIFSGSSQSFRIDVDGKTQWINVNGFAAILIGLLVIAIGILIVWITNLFVFGIGEGIEKISCIEEKMSRLEMISFNSLNEHGETNRLLKKIINDYDYAKGETEGEPPADENSSDGTTAAAEDNDDAENEETQETGNPQ